jgi:hypothetical protein
MVGCVALEGLFQVVSQSTIQGAITTIYLAMSPDVKTEGKGKYIIPIATEGRASKTAVHKDLARKFCS